MLIKAGAALNDAVQCVLQRALSPVLPGLLRFSPYESPFIRDPDGNNNEIAPLGTFATPLMLAAHKGRMQAVQLLLDAGAHVTVKSSCVPFSSAPFPSLPLQHPILNLPLNHQPRDLTPYAFTAKA